MIEYIDSVWNTCYAPVTRTTVMSSRGFEGFAAPAISRPSSEFLDFVTVAVGVGLLRIQSAYEPTAVREAIYSPKWLAHVLDL